ncbi:MAG: glucosamine-6-phosphate isomerase [Candidatus Hydrogenedentes bacterium]|nr:glucosamine-6-phosphate isomerase [Candidatus Hydrogenedentota bacterium]
MDLMSTIQGSIVASYFPEGWDLDGLDKLCSRPPESITKPEAWWNKKFAPVACGALADFDTMMGHEIAHAILEAKMAKKPLAFILPVGPMGMYRWAVYFLKEWNVDCKHVHGFNMDEWSDAQGRSLPAKAKGSFQQAMEEAFYGPLGKLTVPKNQRHFATRESLPKYGGQIRAIKKKGGKLITVFGIGRACHIAFWEPHFAADYASVNAWKADEYRIAAELCAMTVEQNAITSFKSRTTLVSTRANTVGPGLFLKSDRIIGGADGALGRGMQWQGMSLWATLHHKPTPWIPSTFMPTLPGKLFFLNELAGPLDADCN